MSMSTTTRLAAVTQASLTEYMRQHDAANSAAQEQPSVDGRTPAEWPSWLQKFDAFLGRRLW